jgi:hypothetical protein
MKSISGRMDDLNAKRLTFLLNRHSYSERPQCFKNLFKFWTNTDHHHLKVTVCKGKKSAHLQFVVARYQSLARWMLTDTDFPDQNLVYQITMPKRA